MIQLFFAVCILMTGLTCSSNQSKDTELVSIMSLPASLSESSGMASLGEGWFVAHNDSGNPAELYVFKLSKEPDVKTVKIENAKNTDWEELAEDETYIYIGDFGNNSGKRKDLVIYRVKKIDLLGEREVAADRIEFDFPEQIDFTGSGQTNFDCEAMVSIGDSLFLFTKNHGNLKTNLYSLPKTPGDHSAKRLGEFDAEGLITGADYRFADENAELVLVGYTDKLNGHRPFVIYFKDVDQFDIFKSPSERFQFSGHFQVESIVFETPKSLLLTSEGKRKKDRNVYRVMISR